MFQVGQKVICIEDYIEPNTPREGDIITCGNYESRGYVYLDEYLEKENGHRQSFNTIKLAPLTDWIAADEAVKELMKQTEVEQV